MLSLPPPPPYSQRISSTWRFERSHPGLSVCESRLPAQFVSLVETNRESLPVLAACEATALRSSQLFLAFRCAVRALKPRRWHDDHECVPFYTSQGRTSKLEEGDCVGLHCGSMRPRRSVRSRGPPPPSQLQTPQFPLGNPQAAAHETRDAEMAGGGGGGGGQTRSDIIGGWDQIPSVGEIRYCTAALTCILIENCITTCTWISAARCLVELECRSIANAGCALTSVTDRLGDTLSKASSAPSTNGHTAATS